MDVCEAVKPGSSVFGAHLRHPSGDNERMNQVCAMRRLDAACQLSHIHGEAAGQAAIIVRSSVPGAGGTHSELEVDWRTRVTGLAVPGLSMKRAQRARQ